MHRSAAWRLTGSTCGEVGDEDDTDDAVCETREPASKMRNLPTRDTELMTRKLKAAAVRYTVEEDKKQLHMYHVDTLCASWSSPSNMLTDKAKSIICKASGERRTFLQGVSDLQLFSKVVLPIDATASNSETAQHGHGCM